MSQSLIDRQGAPIKQTKFLPISPPRRLSDVAWRGAFQLPTPRRDATPINHRQLVHHNQAIDLGRTVALPVVSSARRELTSTQSRRDGEHALRVRATMASNPNFYIRPEFVHRGAWTNWDAASKMAGGQLTMTKASAELLAVFIGIFIVFVEGGLWVLITYGCFNYNHRYRRRRFTTATPANPAANAYPEGLYHQQQTTLRNESSSIAIGTAFIKLWRAWGRRNPKVIMSTWPLIVGALASFAIFLVALPFVVAYALLDNQGDAILIRSPNCGFWIASFPENAVTASTAQTNQSWEAATYVDSCYESDAPSSLCDKFLPQRRLPMFAWSTAECPFAKEMCLSQEKYPAHKLQTKVLDSHEDFGINSPSNRRVKFQRTTTCAPLAVGSFTKSVPGVLPDEETAAVFFGPSTDNKYTYGVSNYEVVGRPGYTLDVVWSYPQNGSTYSSLFTPIKGLRRSDADVSIVFLNNNRMPIQGTDGPCRDPFFSATKKPLDSTPSYYWPDDPLTAIGCIDQYEFGDSNSRRWTGPMSLGDVTNAGPFIEEWGLSKRQAAAMITISWSLGQGGGIAPVIAGLNEEALWAKKYPGVFSGFQNPIPNDQWKKEVSHWFKIGLAKLQLGLVNVAAGPPDPSLVGLENTLPKLAGSAGAEDMISMICNAQKVHNLEFKNYHLSGFVALAVIGGLLIIVPGLVRWCIVWGWGDREHVQSWISYDLLHLRPASVARPQTGVSLQPVPAVVVVDVEQCQSEEGEASAGGDRALLLGNNNTANLSSGGNTR
ncbi:hypothetical protein G7046_g6760 [Stylonectria norvegica]|nr:hypothetical protein G7046_g6760 [Stylonectria norvegica]